MKLFITSTRFPGLEFEVLSFDPTSNMGTLMGPLGAPFSVNINKTYLTTMGYTIEKRDADGTPPTEDEA